MSELRVSNPANDAGATSGTCAASAAAGAEALRQTLGSQPKLAMLCDLDALRETLAARLGEIAALPWVDGVLALPDLHQKENAEVPSSLAITTSNAIVPEFTSVAINDGMGVVMTDLEARDMTAERVLELFARINGHAAAHVLDANRYSLSARDQKRAALEGGPAGVERYGLDPAVLARMEWGGQVPLPAGAESWRDFVPTVLKATRVGRCEVGLNFGGNHFLELQVVGEPRDRALAENWGLVPGRVVLMYHLGPGPFGSILLHHFSRRRSLHGRRAPVYFLSKLLYHFAPGRNHGSMRKKWDLHFRENGSTAFAPDSGEGLQIRQALAMATNFGFVYRLATVAAIRDALYEVFSPSVGVDLFCDTSHNSLVEEPWGAGTAWVARHNACRAVPGAPGIVAGDHDVPSYLGCGASGGVQELHSYDHGAGHLIDVARRTGRLPVVPGNTTRVRMSRGRHGRVLARDEYPLRSSAPIDGLMTCLERRGIIHPVVSLRPLATLKN